MKKLLEAIAIMGMAILLASCCTYEKNQTEGLKYSMLIYGYPLVDYIYIPLLFEIPRDGVYLTSKYRLIIEKIEIDGENLPARPIDIIHEDANNPMYAKLSEGIHSDTVKFYCAVPQIVSAKNEAIHGKDVRMMAYDIKKPLMQMKKMTILYRTRYSNDLIGPLNVANFSFIMSPVKEFIYTDEYIHEMEKYDQATFDDIDKVSN